MEGESCEEAVTGWVLGVATGGLRGVRRGKDKGEREEWGREREESGGQREGHVIDPHPLLPTNQNTIFSACWIHASGFAKCFPKSTQ